MVIKKQPHRKQPATDIGWLLSVGLFLFLINEKTIDILVSYN